MIERLFLVLIVASFLPVAPEATAHNKSVSYSDWSRGAGQTVIARIRIPARQTTLLLGDRIGQDAFAVTIAHVQSHMHLGRGDVACVQEGDAQILVGAPEMLVFELTFSCPEGAEDALTFRTEAFFGLAAGHLHFVRSAAADSAVPTTETVLTVSMREATLFASTTSEHAATNDWALFGVGVTHILMGVDHLVFVLGLLLIAAPGKDLFIAVTGFTIGHSLALAAAVTGFVTADTQSVEALIAFTIWLLGVLALKSHIADRVFPSVSLAMGLVLAAFLASLGLGTGVHTLFWLGLALLTMAYLALSAREHTRYWPASLVLTASLGLAHGFGFAGGLQEAFGEANSLLVSLIAFNLGVEAGQLVFIAFVLSLGLAFRFFVRTDRVVAPLRFGTASFITLFGAYWFAERALLSGGPS